MQLRRLPGRWEQSCNYVQRTLLSVYDKWSVVTQRALTNAIKRGASQAELNNILTARLADLEGPLIIAQRAGIMRTSSIALGGQLAEHANSHQVLKAISERIAESDKMVTQELLPAIRESVMNHIVQQGPALDSIGIQATMDLQRSKVGWGSGNAWKAIFETQKAALLTDEQEGKGVVPVEWVLDPQVTEHCHMDSKRGTFGCVDLAGIYPLGITSLPTLPAANVSCALNCKCWLRLSFDGGRTYHRITG